MRECEIRRLSPEDEQPAVALITRVLQKEFSAAETVCRTSELSRFYDHYTTFGNAAWVAHTGSKLVGVVAAEEQLDGSLKMCRLYVEPEWRGGGLGRRLVDTVHAWAEDEGYQQIVLATFSEMHAARRLSGSYGYSEYTVEDRGAASVHRYRLTLPTRALGARLPVPALPDSPEGAIVVVVERPRGTLEAVSYTHLTLPTN